jgi:RimJ/RimL family protein N-acetyltransferase
LYEKYIQNKLKRNKMIKLEPKRLVLRDLEPEDFNDFWELSKNWKKAPGPDFDKWPVTENEAKNLFEAFFNYKHGFWIYYSEEKKIIGGFFLNNIDENGFIDMGHVIHSNYQDNDLDKEALFMFIEHIFEAMDVKGIITNNDPDEKQNAPLYSLGFIDRNESGGGLIIEKNNWRNG